MTGAGSPSAVGSDGISGIAEGSGAGAGAGGGGGASGGGGGGVSGGGVGSGSMGLPHGLLFPPAHEFVERDAVHLDDLVSDAGDVAVRAPHAAADPFDEDLVVLVDEVDRAVADREGRHLPSVLDELDLHALAQRGVRLLRLDRDLLEDDALRLRRSLERVRFLLQVLLAPLVVPVGPASRLPFVLEFTRCEEAAGQWRFLGGAL